MSEVSDFLKHTSLGAFLPGILSYNYSLYKDSLKSNENSYLEGSLKPEDSEEHFLGVSKDYVKGAAMDAAFLGTQIFSTLYVNDIGNTYLGLDPGLEEKVVWGWIGASFTVAKGIMNYTFNMCCENSYLGSKEETQSSPPK